MEKSALIYAAICGYNLGCMSLTDDWNPAAEFPQDKHSPHFKKSTGYSR